MWMNPPNLAVAMVMCIFLTGLTYNDASAYSQAAVHHAGMSTQQVHIYVMCVCGGEGGVYISPVCSVYVPCVIVYSVP